MKNIKSFWIVLLILSLFFLGCVGKTPSGTSAPTPTITETPLPTITPTVQSPVITSTPMIYVPATYIVWIDSNYGFYKVREVRENLSVQLPLDLNPANFSINVGDTIRWMNDDSYDFPLTLVSNEGLWIGRAGLMRYQGERITYGFNMTGTYTFSIKEYPRLVSQKITVVNP
jgi:hypothetical protein